MPIARALVLDVLGKARRMRTQSATEAGSEDTRPCSRLMDSQADDTTEGSHGAPEFEVDTGKAGCRTGQVPWRKHRRPGSVSWLGEARS